MRAGLALLLLGCVTDVWGHSVTDTGVVGGDDTEVAGSAQLPPCP